MGGSFFICYTTKVLTINGSSLRDMQKSRRVWGVILSAVVAIIILLLFIQIQSLTAQLESLESRHEQRGEELASYERSRCQVAPAPVLADTTARHALESAGFARSYQVHTPKNYDPNIRYPVIVNFDGIGGNGGNIEGYSGVNELPVIAVYPDALPGKTGFTAWQGAPYSVEGDRDIAFVRDILNQLPATYCIDKTKVFAIGMSNGGGFAAIVGCRMGDAVRAVAGVSGAYYTECHENTRTGSLLVVHGTADKQVPIDGSRKRGLPEVSEWIEKEAQDRKCERSTEDDTHSAAREYGWSRCKNDSLLRLLVLKDQPHGWLAVPGGVERDVHNTTEYIWSFFEEVMYRG